MGNNGSSVQHPAMPGAPLPARPHCAREQRPGGKPGSCVVSAWRERARQGCGTAGGLISAQSSSVLLV